MEPPLLSNALEQLIFLIRGHKVMVDVDLADLYEVSTKALNQAVKRNHERFPADFMFQLTSQESQTFPMRSQIVTAAKAQRLFSARCSMHSLNTG